MTYNEAILSSIISYLQLSGAQEKTTIPNRFSIWHLAFGMIVITTLKSCYPMKT